MVSKVDVERCRGTLSDSNDGERDRPPKASGQRGFHRSSPIAVSFETPAAPMGGKSVAAGAIGSGGSRGSHLGTVLGDFDRTVHVPLAPLEPNRSGKGSTPGSIS